MQITNKGNYEASLNVGLIMSVFADQSVFCPRERFENLWKDENVEVKKQKVNFS